MYVAQIVRNEEGFRKCSILRLTFILKQVAIQRISRAITSCKQLSAPIIMSSCLMISLSKTWKSTVLSWSLDCWSPSALINLVFEKANHAQSNLALQKHFEWNYKKNWFDRSVSNIVISMPDVFTQLNLLYRIRIIIISISPESHVYQLSSLQFYNTYHCCCHCYSFAKWSATEKTGTINDEIVWHYGQC